VDAVVGKIQELASDRVREGKKVAVLATEETAAKYNIDVEVVGARKNPKSIAKNLFTALRKLDEKGVDQVLAEGIEPAGIGLAVMNRLRKASGYKIIHA
jgi:L-threonylcarbamoyladenylate synthase